MALCKVRYCTLRREHCQHRWRSLVIHLLFGNNWSHDDTEIGEAEAMAVVATLINRDRSREVGAWDPVHIRTPYGVHTNNTMHMELIICILFYFGLWNLALQYYCP